MRLSDFGVFPRARNRISKPEFANAAGFESMCNRLRPRCDPSRQRDGLTPQIDNEIFQNGSPKPIESRHQPIPSTIERMSSNDVAEMGICVMAGSVEASPQTVRACLPGTLTR